MPGRLPVPSDFPSIVSYVTPPPTSQRPVNVLILLHGLGDTNLPFTKLGQQLCLPETACISLQAPLPLPFNLGGYHLGDDIIFDQSTGQMDFDTGFAKATVVLTDLLSVLMDSCGYQPREILLFGFGQGGMAALATMADSKTELGGIISIGGPLPVDRINITAKNRSPVLVLGGSSETLISSDAIARLRTAFEFVEYEKWSKIGDGMPRTQQETLPIMQFFSRRLRSLRGVPEGSVEIS